MELSATRKLLAVIISVIIAFSTALTITSFAIGSTLASQSFFKKNAVTGELISQCEAQLSAKYKTLEAQSGIPADVFETIKLEYPIGNSLNTAFQNVFSSENPELYNDALVDHFEKLCTDYLDGNHLKYNKTYIRNTATEAAEIFSDTVGLHNMGTASDKMSALKDASSLVTMFALVLLAVSIVLIFMLFSKRKSGYVYIFSSITGGAAGTAIGAFLCKIISPLEELGIAPEVYKSAMISVFGKSMLYTAAAGFVIAVSSLIANLITYTKKKSK